MTQGVLQGRVTKCYKIVSQCVTRKFDKWEEEGPSQ